MSGETTDNPLAALLALEEHARQAANSMEIAFVMVNETRFLAPYRQAALFTDADGVMAVSGVSGVERDAPFTLWLERVFRHLERNAQNACLVGPELLLGRDGEEWSEWLPRHGLWVALRSPDGTRPGSLLFVRDEPWSEAETTLLARAVAMFGPVFSWHCRASSFKAGWRRIRKRTAWRLGFAVAGALLLAMPVRLSVLAPAEVVASNPAVVRSPLEGVIERVLVKPNQAVSEGQLLFVLDRTSLEGKLEVARRGLATARAELEQNTQQAFFEIKAKAQLSILTSRAEERVAEVAQLEELLARCDVRAPRRGLALIDDPSEWAGRPVAVGEKVVAVADPGDVEMEAWLSPADVIELEGGGPAMLFLNTDPLSPLGARLEYVAFEATLLPDGTLGHRVRAAFEKSEDRPRLGLKGTARLDGRRVALAYWLLRRPLAAVRRTLGL
nr:Membrane-fusion protein [uncultured bacterium]